MPLHRVQEVDRAAHHGLASLVRASLGAQLPICIRCNSIIGRPTERLHRLQEALGVNWLDCQLEELGQGLAYLALRKAMKPYSSPLAGTFTTFPSTFVALSFLMAPCCKLGSSRASCEVHQKP
jgi:hypothetical protein